MIREMAYKTVQNDTIKEIKRFYLSYQPSFLYRFIFDKVIFLMSTK